MLQLPTNMSDPCRPRIALNSTRCLVFENVTLHIIFPFNDTSHELLSLTKINVFSIDFGRLQPLLTYLCICSASQYKGYFHPQCNTVTPHCLEHTDVRGYPSTAPVSHPIEMSHKRILNNDIYWTGPGKSVPTLDTRLQ